MDREDRDTLQFIADGGELKRDARDRVYLNEQRVFILAYSRIASFLEKRPPEPMPIFDFYEITEAGRRALAAD